MRRNRRDEERERAVERKAAAQARQMISKAERAASRSPSLPPEYAGDGRTTTGTHRGALGVPAVYTWTWC